MKNMLGERVQTLSFVMNVYQKDARGNNNEKAAAWVKSAGSKASQGTFADSAAFGEIIFNCSKGIVTEAGKSVDLGRYPRESSGRVA